MYLLRQCYQKATLVFFAGGLLVVFAVQAAQPPWQMVQSISFGADLQLQQGGQVALAGIYLPDKQAARQAMGGWLGERVRILPVQEGENRHGAIPAHVEGEDGRTWQERLLREGLAWRTHPHSMTSWQQAEREAEQKKRGIWSRQDTAVLGAEEAGQGVGQFRLVEGVVRHAGQGKKRYYLNFGEDWKTDFTLFIEPAAMRNFDEAWLKGLEGQHVRVRGWLFRAGGAAMELTHPQQVELPEGA